MTDRDWIAGEHVLQRRGLRWPPGFFTGQAGCFCCASAAKGYHPGGYNSVGAVQTAMQEYNQSSDTWANMTAITSARAIAAGCTLNAKVYVAFGRNSLNVKQQTLYEYVVDSWATKTSGPSPARDAATASANSTDMFVIGGSDTTSTIVSDNDSYNQSGDSWTSKTDIVSPARSTFTSGMLSSYIYCSAGTSGSALRDCDRYDPSGDSWASKSDIPSPARTIWGNSGVLSSKLYITHGQDGGTYYADTEEYVEDSWTSKTDGTRALMPSGSSAIGTAIHVVGGINGTSPFVYGDNDQYVVDSWTSKQVMLATRDYGGFSEL